MIHKKTPVFPKEKLMLTVLFNGFSTVFLIFLWFSMYFPSFSPPLFPSFHPWRVSETGPGGGGAQDAAAGVQSGGAEECEPEEALCAIDCRRVSTSI